MGGRGKGINVVCQPLLVQVHSGSCAFYSSLSYQYIVLLLRLLFMPLSMSLFLLLHPPTQLLCSFLPLSFPLFSLISSFPSSLPSYLLYLHFFPFSFVYSLVSSFLTFFLPSHSSSLSVPSSLPFSLLFLHFFPIFCFLFLNFLFPSLTSFLLIPSRFHHPLPSSSFPFNLPSYLPPFSFTLFVLKCPHVHQLPGT